MSRCNKARDFKASAKKAILGVRFTKPAGMYELRRSMLCVFCLDITMQHSNRTIEIGLRDTKRMYQFGSLLDKMIKLAISRDILSLVFDA